MKKCKTCGKLHNRKLKRKINGSYETDFCSPRCQNTYSSNITRGIPYLEGFGFYKDCTCQNCGKEYKYKVDGRRVKGDVPTLNYCSKECQDAANKKSKRESRERKKSKRESRERKKVKTKKCAVCRKEYISDGTRRMTCGSEECKKEFRNYLNRRLRQDRRDSGKGRFEKKCKKCGDVFHTDDVRTVFCSQECAKNIDPTRVYRGGYGQTNNMKIPVDWTKFYVDKFWVFERDNWQCQNCGCKVKKYEYGRSTKMDDEANLDHIVPIVYGGPHVLSNVQTLCRKCNCKIKKAGEFHGPPINWKVGTPWYRW